MTSTGPGRWTVRVWADPDHHELVRARVGPGDAPVPPFPPEAEDVEVELVGEEVRIGRRGVPDADDPAPDPAPDVDLLGPTGDPGVSRLHVVLLAVGPDRWVAVDAGSRNGTSLNYGAERLEPGTAVPLEAGDRLHVGAWTTLTVGRR